jgi:hypothetical protein
VKLASFSVLFPFLDLICISYRKQMPIRAQIFDIVVPVQYRAAEFFRQLPNFSLDLA